MQDMKQKKAMVKFNKREYDVSYKKEHKAQFKVDLNKNEKINLDLILKEYNISQADFLRNAIREFKIKTKNDNDVERIKFIKKDIKGNYIFKYMNKNQEEVVDHTYLNNIFTVEECFRYFLKKDVLLTNPEDLNAK